MERRKEPTLERGLIRLINWLLVSGFGTVGIFGQILKWAKKVKILPTIFLFGGIFNIIFRFQFLHIPDLQFSCRQIVN
jgi:hypothetical protein